jgi:hypothetical protein
MLAARLPGNSTYDNPRYGQIRGCRGLPHFLTPVDNRKAGTLAPTRQARSCISKERPPGETPVARGAGGCRGFPMADHPR